jgi:hypothetical protein
MRKRSMLPANRIAGAPGWLTALALALLAIGQAGSAVAVQVNLAWEGVTGAGVYEVHYGETSCEGVPYCAYPSQQGTRDNPPKTTMTVPESGSGLTPGDTYYFAVRACEIDTTTQNPINCSPFSNEVSARIPLPETDTYGDGIADSTDPDHDNDGIADWADPDPLDATVAPAPVWLPEAAARSNHDWTLVDAASGYTEAVVIAGPPTMHGDDSGVVRLKNVTDRGFELRFQEWEYHDGAHELEDIPYAVLQRGRHQLSDGAEWEVGTFGLGGTRRWKSVSFTRPFSKPPHLLLTVQTYNGVDAVTVRARNVSVDGFQAALFEEEALMDGHAAETIGYVAVDSPGGGVLNLDGTQVPYLRQSLSADERWSPVLSQRLKVEEEESKDTETNHVDETLHVLALGVQFFAQQVSDNGGDTAVLRRLAPTNDAKLEWGLIRGLDHQWQTLPFANTYDNPNAEPVLVVTPASNTDGDPGVIRIKELGPTYARVRYQEWNYLDGVHPKEDAFYMVAEAGVHDLGGLTVEADYLDTNKLARAGDWETIDFNAFFTAPLSGPPAPVLLASVMTDNGSDAVTTRIDNLDLTGFELAMDEQESIGDGHVYETLGWIAIQSGTGITAEGRRLDALFSQLDHNLTPVTYPATATGYRHPTVLGAVDSSFGMDPVSLRYANPTQDQIELKLTEESSIDAEVDHVVEDVGILIGD